MNEKPGQTDFCSQQMPVEAQSDSLAVGSTATASDTGGSTKKKHSKINNKDVLMDIVTEIKETRKDKSLSTSFGMSKSPEEKN